MVRVKKSELVDYDLDGITIMYNGKEWRIPYGRYVSKTDIDKADDDTYIYIQKFGRWVVARVGEYKKRDNAQTGTAHTHDDNASQTHRNGVNLQDTLERIQNTLMELQRRVQALEEHVNTIEVRLKEW